MAEILRDKKHQMSLLLKKSMWAETTETLVRPDLQKSQARERRNYCLGKQIILCFEINLKRLYVSIIPTWVKKIFCLPNVVKKKKRKKLSLLKYLDVTLRALWEINWHVKKGVNEQLGKKKKKKCLAIFTIEPVLRSINKTL